MTDFGCTLIGLAFFLLGLLGAWAMLYFFSTGKGWADQGGKI